MDFVSNRTWKKKTIKRTHSDIERDLNNKNKAVTVRNR